MQNDNVRQQGVVGIMKNWIFMLSQKVFKLKIILKHCVNQTSES